MRKSIALAFLICVSVLTIQSCRKCDMPDKQETSSSQTINVSLQTNESYSYSLPVSTADREYSITSQASHFTVSETAKDATGNFIYHYTPSTDFSGNDQVVISSVRGNHHGGCGNNAGQNNCQHHDENSIITIHFTITTPPVSTK